MKIIMYLFVIFLLSLNAFSQNVSEKIFLDTSASCYINSTLINQDGSMTFCGTLSTNNSISKQRALMMKLNADYSLRWVKSFQRQDSTAYFLFEEIFTVNDTAYFVLYNTGHTSDIYGFMLIDSAGNILYNKEITDSIQQFSGAITDIFQDNDSTYLISIWQSPNAILLKTNLHGNILAQRTFQSYLPEYGTPIIKLFDGNYLYVTHDIDNSNEILNLHCMNSNLDTVWNKGYHLAPDWASLQSNWIMQLADSSIWMIGSMYPSPTHQASRSVICKLTSGGEMLWSRQYRYISNVYSFETAIELNGKIYVMTPWTPSSGSLWRAMGISVLDTSGLVLSKQTYIHGNNLYSDFLNIKNDSLLMGFQDYNSRQFGFIVVDTNLTTPCSSDNLTLIIDTISPTKYNFASYTSSTLKFIDVSEIYTTFTPVFSEDVFCMQTGTDYVKSNGIHVYPNPSSETIRFELFENNAEVKIYISDVYGRFVFEETSVNSNDFNIDVSQFVTGLYFATIRANGFRKTVSFIKM